MEKRIGVIGIVVDDHKEWGEQVNDYIREYSHIIVGRMGIPYRERGISVIALIVEGTTDEIGAFTGKLGNLKGVTVKSALTSKKFYD
ncbi:iron-only hydrogenase system regulator [Caldicoprobacter algeriensis]|uniref:TM1266 family iron-only hydrogenase system putative regulator n=1 Tax=Caldicoprobacter algeriensis TaxID=699281 RepID=UPI0020797246|nr:TM1266 family iron-only hydrogenase system putative regulator [Caldicoprobacter algeriensis]MCM8900018.1 iron-only hydrogenase system regulator [Caldicoprobacter algeriensis]